MTLQPACASPDVDPEWFFPPSTADLDAPASAAALKTLNNYSNKQARRICARCPLRQQCLDDHLTEEYGIWGGLGPRERRKLAQERGVIWPKVRGKDYVDEEVLVRAEWTEGVKLTKAERVELIRRMFKAGRKWDDISKYARASGERIKDILLAA